MKKIQLYLLIVVTLFGTTLLAQNPFSDLRQQAGDAGIDDQDVPGKTVVHIGNSEIQGSLGIGVDIFAGYPYGFDTFVLRENNLRILFDDTSSTASFPDNDWGLEANESTNGGMNWFRIVDRTAGRGVFTVEAGARNNALYIDSQGDIGVGTNNPATDVHVQTGDTPTYRIAQDNSSGFAPQTWDIAGNETNFFIRDFTNGSTLPFRIRPGADSSAIDIGADGTVGINGPANNANVSLSLEEDDRGMLLNRLDNAQRATLGGLIGASEEGMLVYDIEDNAAYIWDGAAWVAAGTDDQQLSLNVNSLDLENSASVDLSGYLDNTDDQIADLFQLNGNDLELSLEDDGAPVNTVDLSVYLDNTDNQNISGSGLAGNQLTIGISGGTSEVVDLSALDNPGTDDQQLSLAGNNLNLEDGGSVDLSGYLDNTDNQNLSNFILSPPILSIAIVGGNSISVNLDPLIEPLEDENAAQQNQIDDLLAENAAQQALIDDLIARVEALEACECTLGIEEFDANPDRAYLLQNIPNPFDNSTSIGYFVPFNHSRASIVISTTTGQILENIQLSRFGQGEISVSKDRMSSAIYFYTLFVDGKKIDSKRMVVE